MYNLRSHCQSGGSVRSVDPFAVVENVLIAISPKRLLNEVTRNYTKKDSKDYLKEN